MKICCYLSKVLMNINKPENNRESSTRNELLSGNLFVINWQILCFVYNFFFHLIGIINKIVHYEEINLIKLKKVSRNS